MNLWKWSAIKYGDHRTAVQLMQGERLKQQLAAALEKIPVVMIQKRAVEPVAKVEEKILKWPHASSR